MSTTDHLNRALRRIDTLEAVRRRVLRSLGRCTPGSVLSADLTRQRDELTVQITYWRGIVARALRCPGAKVWSRRDFVRGDFVGYRGTWYEVLRVNPRSLTVPRVPPGGAPGNAVRQSCESPGSWTLGYYCGITGHMRADEVPEPGVR